MSTVQKRKTRRPVPLYIAAAVIALTLLAVVLRAGRREPPEAETVDPHAGQVLINDGVNEVWITPAEGVEVSPFTKEDFRTADGLPCYVGSDYTAVQGIDISEFQSPVDWAAVKASGVDFAIIRCGGRSYGDGHLYDDDAFADNVRGALNAGVQVGVYFFSQAITPEEAEEEADLTLSLLEGFDISLPVFWDWERPSAETARTRQLDLSALTDMARVFCDTIAGKGYTPGIYFNRQLGYYAYDWARLSDCARWVADLNAWPDFYYGIDFWQYSFDGSVDGIGIQTDRNMMFIQK